MSQPLILVIEDHALFKVGLTTALQTLTGVEIVETGSIEQAAGYNLSPNVILLDVQLTGISGLDGITMIRSKWPSAVIVMLSAHDSHANRTQAQEQGVFAFLSKADSTDTILTTVRKALQTTGITVSVPGQQPGNQEVTLSERQIEVLRLLAKGLSNKAIGNMLGVSENTIRWHVRTLLQVLNVSTRAEATYAATRLGLIS